MQLLKWMFGLNYCMAVTFSVCVSCCKPVKEDTVQTLYRHLWLFQSWKTISHIDFRTVLFSLAFYLMVWNQCPASPTPEYVWDLTLRFSQPLVGIHVGLITTAVIELDFQNSIIPVFSFMGTCIWIAVMNSCFHLDEKKIRRAVDVEQWQEV